MEQQSLVNVWREMFCVYNIMLTNYIKYIAIMCATLSNPGKGQVAVNNHTVGSIATYTCNNGYNITGENLRLCEQNGTTGQWTPEEPTCSRKLMLSHVQR